MIVTYVGGDKFQPPYLTLNKDYIVYGMEDNEKLYSILNDHGQLRFYYSKTFQISAKSRLKKWKCL